jgi:hypothetical protein
MSAMDTITKPKVTPKDFFLWLGAMAALYVSVISLLTLYFQYINNLFPDVLNSYVDPYSSTIRFAIASLVVATPLYIYLTRMLNADIRAVPEKKELWVRRWLIYITLFVGGITLAGDLVALINTFLGGDLTTRFILKVVAVFVVVYGFFWYYLADLRGRWEREEKTAHMLGYLMGAVVIVSIAGGFFIIGSPFDQRLYRFDEQKVSDLTNIQWQIVNYYQQKGRVPLALADLQDPISGFIVPADPQSNAAYTYTSKDKLSFSLCASFNKESRATGQQYITKPAVPTEVGVSSATDLSIFPWEHGAGEKCFDRTIDPERYPLFKK